MNCPNCDRPRAAPADYLQPADDVCYAINPQHCTGEPIDWRARALAAEAELLEAHLTVASIAIERNEAQGFSGRTVIRNVEYLTKIRRLEAGKLPQGEDLIAVLRRKHAEQITARDAAIEALTQRVEELMRVLKIRGSIHGGVS